MEHRFLPYFDSLFYLGGILSPIVAGPQVYKIFYLHNATGVSLTSWSLYTLGALCLLVYGLLHRQKPMIFLYAIDLPLYTLIVVGILLYG